MAEETEDFSAEAAKNIRDAADNAHDLTKGLQESFRVLSDMNSQTKIGASLISDVVKNSSGLLKIQMNRGKIEADLVKNTIINDKRRLILEERKADLSRKTSDEAILKVYSIEDELKALNELIREETLYRAVLNDSLPMWATVLAHTTEIFNRLSKTTPELDKIKSLVISMGNPYEFIKKILEASLERWVELDKAAEKFRINTGLIIPQMLGIEKSVRQINTQFAYMGITLEKAYGSAQALYGALQTSQLATTDMISLTAQMAEKLGLMITDVAKFESMFSQIVKSSGSTTKNVIMLSAALANAAGVAPKQVMDDMANASGKTLSFLAKNPLALIRAAVEARRLGTSLNSISDSARGMLDYQQSMTDEMTASAIIGRNISFQQARELAWQGKVDESRKEALRVVSSIGDFTKLNVWQQEQLAKASGMTVGEIIKQQNQQKLLNELKKTDPELVKKYEQVLDLTKLTGKAALDAQLMEQKQMMKNMLIQSELTKMTNSIYGAWVDIKDSLLPIANVIMPIIVFSVRLIASSFKLIGALIRGILAPLDVFAKKFRSGEDSANKIESILKDINDWFDKISPSVTEFGTLLSTLIIPLSAIIKLLSMDAPMFASISTHILRIGKSIPTVSSVISPLIKKMELIGKQISLIGSNMSAFNKMGQIFSGISKLFSPFSKFFSIFSTVGRLFMPFFKLLPVIGWIIAALQIGYELFTDWSEIWSNDNMSVGDKILKSLVAIPKAIWNCLVQPFVSAIDWIMEKMGLSFNLSEILTAMYDSFIGMGSKMIQPFVNSMYEIWEAVVNIFDGKDIATNIVKVLYPIGKLVMQSLLWPFTAAWGLISPWFGGLGLSIVKGISSVGSAIFDFLTSPFTAALGLISSWFSGLGPLIVIGISSVGSAIFDFLTSPFKKAWEFIGGWLGSSPSELGSLIVMGISSVGSAIFDFLTSPFKKAWEFIKNLPFIKNLFGTTKDAVIEVSNKIKSSTEIATNSVIEIKNLDSLKEVISQLTAAVVKLGGVAGQASTVITQPPSTNDSAAMVSKLEELISLLKAGGIVVNLDGRKVSSALSQYGT